MFCVSAFTPAVFAQTTIKLFDPVYLNNGAAGSFGTTSAYLSCPTNPTGILSSPGTFIFNNYPLPIHGGLIIDDELLVNGQNVCPNGGSCFSGILLNNVIDDYAYNFPGEYPAEYFYIGVGTINISNQLTAGINQYTFNLMNDGDKYGSSEIDLNTNCVVIPHSRRFSRLSPR